MSTNLARFRVRVNSGAWSPSTDLGVDVSAGDTVELQLETSAVRSVQFRGPDSSSEDAPLASEGASELTLSNGSSSGKAVSPTSITGVVSFTVPSDGFASWRVECVVDGGVDAQGVPSELRRFARVISLRDANAIRALVPGETTDYESRGWTDDLNRALTALAQGQTAAGAWDQSVTTTDATVTDMVTIAIPDNCVVSIGARWKSKDVTTGDVLFRESHFYYMRQNGGLPTLIGTVTDLINVSADATHEATIAVSGNSVVLRGKGDASNDCEWHVVAWPRFESLDAPSAATAPSATWDRVETSDATETTVLTYATASDTLYRFVVRWLGREEATGDLIVRDSIVVYANVGGTLTQLGVDGDMLDYKAAGAAAWGTSHTDSGTDVLFRVTGEAAHTIGWLCRVEVDTEAL